MGPTSVCLGARCFLVIPRWSSSFGLPEHFGQSSTMPNNIQDDRAQELVCQATFSRPGSRVVIMPSSTYQASVLRTMSSNDR
jgi:hypothetical protein